MPNPRITEYWQDLLPALSDPEWYQVQDDPAFNTVIARTDKKQSKITALGVELKYTIELGIIQYTWGFSAFLQLHGWIESTTGDCRLEEFVLKKDIRLKDTDFTTKQIEAQLLAKSYEELHLAVVCAKHKANLAPSLEANEESES